MPLFFFLLTLTIRVLLPISSPLGPVPWLSLSSLHPFRQRQIRWGPAHCKAVSPNRPLTLKLTVRVRGWGSDMKGEWCCFPCSCSEGQHFKRDDPQTSLRMKPNFHWLNCKGIQEPLHPQKPSASGTPLMTVYPQQAWGDLRLSHSYAMSEDWFCLSKFQSIPSPMVITMSQSPPLQLCPLLGSFKKGSPAKTWFHSFTPQKRNTLVLRFVPVHH